MATEEEIKLRVLAPWLSALGIPPDRLKAETSFRLQLGRHAYTKKGDEAATAGGRLDLLVTNDLDEPLFILECKRPGDALSPEDVDQGISYARLLPRIAPFVVVSSGCETRLYDSITRAELTQIQVPGRWSDWQRGTALAGADDVALRAEALEQFISYAPANLRNFCAAQVAARMATLLSAGPAGTGLYLPGAFLARSNIVGAFDRFMASEATAFVLDGESGHGKTSELCALAERLADSGHLVLFFRAADLWGSVFERLAEEFNWSFSDQGTPVHICKRLARLAERCDRTAVVVVDGIDEYPSGDAPQQFGDLAYRFHQLGPRLKLAVSLKTYEWPRFAETRGAMSCLRSHTFLPEPPEPAEGPGRTPRPSTSVTVAKFNPDEARTALDRYRSAFRFTGNPSRELQAAMVDPFLMRLVSEAFAGRELPSSLGTPDLLATYVTRKLSALPPGQVSTARRGLTQVAQRALESGSSTVDVSVGDVPEALAAAITSGILGTSTDARGRQAVSFTFDRLRDYWIAYHVLQLDRIPLAALEGHACKLAGSSLGRSVLQQFVGHEPRESDRHGGLHPALCAAVKCVAATYNKLRAQLGRKLQERTLPGLPVGPVTVAYGLYPRGMWVFGFAPGPAGNAGALILLPDLWDMQDGAAAKKNPCRGTVRSQPIWAMLEDPERFAADLVLESLKQVAAGGGLDEGSSELVCVEKVYAIAAAKRADLGLQPCRSGRTSGRSYGIDLGVLQTEALRRRVHAYYASHQGPYHDHRGVPLARAARLKLETEARERALAGERIRWAYGNAPGPFWALEDALDDLEALGRPRITHHLPPPDRDAGSPEGHSESLQWCYSDETLRRVIKALLLGVEREGVALVRANFGLMAKGLLRDENGPELMIVHLDRRRLKAGIHGDDAEVRWSRCPAGVSDVLVFFDDDDPFRCPVDGSHWRHVVNVDGRAVVVEGFSVSGFDDFVGGRCRVPIGWKGGGETYGAPLRALIYSRIARALDALLPHDVLASCGVLEAAAGGEGGLSAQRDNPP